MGQHSLSCSCHCRQSGIQGTWDQVYHHEKFASTSLFPRAPQLLCKIHSYTFSDFTVKWQKVIFDANYGSFLHHSLTNYFFYNNFNTTYHSALTIGKMVPIKLCYIFNFYWRREKKKKKGSILPIEIFNKLISMNLKAINLLKKLLTYFHYAILQIKYLWDSRIRSSVWEEMSLLRTFFFFFFKLEKIR